MVAQRLQRRGVEAFAAACQRQVYGELADDRLARTGGRADQHTVTAFQRGTGPPLEVVEGERQLGREPGQFGQGLRDGQLR